MVHADIEALAEGELGRDGPFEPTVGDLGAVDQQRDLAPLPAPPPS